MDADAPPAPTPAVKGAARARRRVLRRALKRPSAWVQNPWLLGVLSVAALVLGAVELYWLWARPQTVPPKALGSPERSLAIFWTVGPPIWFFVQFYIVKWAGRGGDLDGIKDGQRLAGAFWAGILASILFLKGP